jgi:hypothetical protein
MATCYDDEDGFKYWSIDFKENVPQRIPENETIENLQGYVWTLLRTQSSISLSELVLAAGDYAKIVVSV